MGILGLGNKSVSKTKCIVVREDIKQQEKKKKSERQEEIKEMGYNKYGGLDMTIETFEESKKKSNALKKGESTFQPRSENTNGNWKH